MRQFFRTKLRRDKSNATSPPSIPTTCVVPSQPCVIPGPAHEQTQSALFGNLSAELRLLIYEAALTDSTRLLHIIPRHGAQKHIGHWRCEETTSLFPTWQHSCFGIWVSSKGMHDRIEPRSNSDLISLLLTCRRIYSEAVEILYAANEFSFKGAIGVLEFKSLVPVHHWHAIRYVYISTAFLTPMSLAPDCYDIPPESYSRWEKACSALSTLEHLQRLFIDFTIWNFHDYNGRNSVENDALVLD